MRRSVGTRSPSGLTRSRIANPISLDDPTPDEFQRLATLAEGLSSVDTHLRSPGLVLDYSLPKGQELMAVLAPLTRRDTQTWFPVSIHQLITKAYRLALHLFTAGPCYRFVFPCRGDPFDPILMTTGRSVGDSGISADVEATNTTVRLGVTPLVIAFIRGSSGNWDPTVLFRASVQVDKGN